MKNVIEALMEKQSEIKNEIEQDTKAIEGYNTSIESRNKHITANSLYLLEIDAAIKILG